MEKGTAKIDEQFLRYITYTRDGMIYNYTDERTQMIDGRYHVYPVGISKSQVYICCPYCKEFHAHGNPDGNYSGHRIPHCDITGNESKKGYIIDHYEGIMR